MIVPDRPGGQEGGQGGLNRISSTTTAPSQTYSFTIPTSASSATPISYSTSTDAPLTSPSKGVLLGAIFGGLAGLLLLAALVICLYQWRKKKKISKRINSRSITYASVSGSPGVPFRRSTQGWRETLPPPTHASNATSSQCLIPSQGAEIPSEVMSSELEGRLFFTSYQNRTTEAHSDSDSVAYTPSPRSSTDTLGLPIMAPRTPPMVASPSSPQHKYNTMAFPIDPTIGALRTPHPELTFNHERPISIVSPRPLPPLVQNASLEAVVQHYLRVTDSPTPAPLPCNAARLRLMAQEPPSESPVLGEMHPVRMNPIHMYNEDSILSLASNGRLPPHPGRQLGRNASQRSVNSVSTMGVKVITNEELDRLGVGVRI